MLTIRHDILCYIWRKIINIYWNLKFYRVISLFLKFNGNSEKIKENRIFLSCPATSSPVEAEKPLPSGHPWEAYPRYAFVTHSNRGGMIVCSLRYACCVPLQKQSSKWYTLLSCCCCCCCLLLLLSIHYGESLLGIIVFFLAEKSRLYISKLNPQPRTPVRLWLAGLPVASRSHILLGEKGSSEKFQTVFPKHTTCVYLPFA